MSEIKATAADIERVKASVEKTLDRFEREGYNRDDEGMGTLREFCDFLLGRGSETVDLFLSGQDMELP